MVLIVVLLCFAGLVLGLNMLTYHSNKALWQATEHLRMPNRRYTPREMRAILETEKAEKLNKGY